MIAAAPGELWRPEDGAPTGPEFDVLVPSKTQAGLDYRIARDLAGVIFHKPACLAWRKRGPCVCAHVRRAIELSEDPAWTFVEDVIEAWNAGGWAPGRAREEFGAHVFRSAQLALRRRDALEEIAELADRRRSETPEQARERAREALSRHSRHVAGDAP